MGSALTLVSVRTALNYRTFSWCQGKLLGVGLKEKKNCHVWRQKRCEYGGGVRLKEKCTFPTHSLLCGPPCGYPSARTWNTLVLQLHQGKF